MKIVGKNGLGNIINTSNMLLGRNSIFNNTTNNIKEHINI